MKNKFLQKVGPMFSSWYEYAFIAHFWPKNGIIPTRYFTVEKCIFFVADASG